MAAILTFLVSLFRRFIIKAASTTRHPFNDTRSGFAAWKTTGRLLPIGGGADEPATLDTIEEALKEDYGPGLREAVNNSNPVWTEINKDWRKTGGKHVRWPIHVAFSSATGARGEEEATPEADHGENAEATENLKYWYHIIRVSGPSMELSEGDQYSFISTLEQEMKDAKNALNRDIARVTLQNTSAAGILGTVASSSTGTTITLETTTDRAKMLFFFKRLKIDIYSSAGAYKATRRITAVNIDARTLTVDSAVSVATNDTIHRQGTRNKEYVGLPGIVNNTGTLHGIDSAVETDWQSVVVGDGTDGITEELVEELYDEMAVRGLGNEPELIIWSHAQRRKLAAQLQVQKRYDGKQTTLKAGWKGLEVARGTAVADRFALTNDVFIIDRSELAKFTGREFDWDRQYGHGNILRSVEGADSFRGRFKGYVTIGTYNRKALGRLKVSA